MKKICLHCQYSRAAGMLDQDIPGDGNWCSNSQSPRFRTRVKDGDGCEKFTHNIAIQITPFKRWLEMGDYFVFPLLIVDGATRASLEILREYEELCLKCCFVTGKTEDELLGLMDKKPRNIRHQYAWLETVYQFYLTYGRVPTSFEEATAMSVLKGMEKK